MDCKTIIENLKQKKNLQDTFLNFYVVIEDKLSLDQWNQLIVSLLDIVVDKNSLYQKDALDNFFDIFELAQKFEPSQIDIANKPKIANQLFHLIKNRNTYSFISDFELSILSEFFYNLDFHKLDRNIEQIVFDLNFVIDEKTKNILIKHLFNATPPIVEYTNLFAVLEIPNQDPELYYRAAVILRNNLGKGFKKEFQPFQDKIYKNQIGIFKKFLSQNKYKEANQILDVFYCIPPIEENTARIIMIELAKAHSLFYKNGIALSLLKNYFVISKIVYLYPITDKEIFIIKQKGILQLKQDWKSLCATQKISKEHLDNGIQLLNEIFYLIVPTQKKVKKLSLSKVNVYLQAVLKNLPLDAKKYEYDDYANSSSFAYAGKMTTVSLAIIFFDGCSKKYNLTNYQTILENLLNQFIELCKNSIDGSFVGYTYSFALTALRYIKTNNFMQKHCPSIPPDLKSRFKQNLYKVVDQNLPYYSYDIPLTHELATTTITLIKEKENSLDEKYIKRALHQLESAIQMKNILKISYQVKKSEAYINDMFSTPEGSIMRSLVLNLARYLSAPKDEKRKENLVTVLLYFCKIREIIENTCLETDHRHPGNFGNSKYYYFSSICYFVMAAKLTSNHPKTKHVIDELYTSLLNMLNPQFDEATQNILPFIGEGAGNNGYTKNLIYSNVMGGLALLAFEDIFTLF